MLLPARPAPNLVSSPGRNRGFENSTQKGCPGSQHALWPSVVDLKSVCPGVPVRLSRQQYLLINLFIDLLGCTWGFSREELQTSRPPSIQPSVRLKFGLKMPLGLEWADLKPAQSPGRTAGQGSEALKDQGQSVRKQADCNSSRGQGTLPAVGMAPPAVVQCGTSASALSWRRGYYGPVARVRERHISISRDRFFSSSAVSKRPPSQGRG